MPRRGLGLEGGAGCQPVRGSEGGLGSGATELWEVEWPRALWRPGTAVARNSSMVVVSSSPCMI